MLPIESLRPSGARPTAEPTSHFISLPTAAGFLFALALFLASFYLIAPPFRRSHRILDLFDGMGVRRLPVGQLEYKVQGRAMALLAPHVPINATL